MNYRLCAAVGMLLLAGCQTPAQRVAAIETALAEVNPDDLTPREALEVLYRLRGLLAD